MQGMNTVDQKRNAIIIEPEKDLADSLCDFLTSLGYVPHSVHTHSAGASYAATLDKVHLLAACVPAPDEDRAGIYLEEAAKKNHLMAVVLMLNDTLEKTDGSPRQAVSIVKPFDRATFIEAIRASEAKCRNN